jgi:hypothetical protein
MAQTIRVTAPYVTLKIEDPISGVTLRGYYEGSIVEHVNDESAKHHLDGGMAEKVAKDAEPEGPPIVPLGEDVPDPDKGKPKRS